MNEVGMVTMSEYNAREDTEFPYKAFPWDYDASFGRGPYPAFYPDTLSPVFIRIVVENDNTSGTQRRDLFLPKVHVYKK